MFECLVCWCLCTPFLLVGAWVLAHRFEPHAHVSFTAAEVVAKMHEDGTLWRVELPNGETRTVSSFLRLTLTPGQTLCTEVQRGRLTGDERLRFVLWHDACGLSAAGN